MIFPVVGMAHATMIAGESAGLQRLDDLRAEIQEPGLL
jgi:hypothetical protein